MSLHLELYNYMLSYIAKKTEKESIEKQRKHYYFPSVNFQHLVLQQSYFAVFASLVNYYYILSR